MMGAGAVEMMTGRGGGRGVGRGGGGLGRGGGMRLTEDLDGAGEVGGLGAGPVQGSRGQVLGGGC